MQAFEVAGNYLSDRLFEHVQTLANVIPRYSIHKHMNVYPENGNIEVVKELLCSGAKYEWVLSMATRRRIATDPIRTSIMTFGDFKRGKSAFDRLRMSFLRSCSRFENDKLVVAQIPREFKTNLMRACAPNRNIRSLIYFYLGIHCWECVVFALQLVITS